MWPFSKSKEEVIYLPCLYENTPRYRIKPESKEQFYVERWYGQRWSSATEWKAVSGQFGWPIPVRRATEQEAEEWIRDKLVEFYRQQAYEKEREEFQKNNPPREVPPFKYATEKTPTTT